MKTNKSEFYTNKKTNNSESSQFFQAGAGVDVRRCDDVNQILKLVRKGILREYVQELLGIQRFHVLPLLVHPLLLLTSTTLTVVSNR